MQDEEPHQSDGGTQARPEDATLDPIEALAARLAAGGPDLLEFAARISHQHPTDPALLQLAAEAALCEKRPEHALRFLKRIEKRYVPVACDHVIRALGLAQQGLWDQARRLLTKQGLPNADIAIYAFYCPNQAFTREARATLRAIFDPRRRPAAARRPRRGARAGRKRASAPRTPSKPKARRAAADASEPERGPAVPAPPARTEGPYPLSFSEPQVAMRFELPGAADFAAHPRDEDRERFGLRRRLAELVLARSFDDLLCLPTLRSVDTYWYQVETVRKVLKQMRGRVLLADEVGLGKTIEAGMIVKEYLLRGMARKVLILAPASLVGQWSEELTTKFDLSFATTRDASFRADAESFWKQDLILASIATARRPPHADILAREPFDVVVVDEAHHLKNRRTRGHALVNSLRKRFLVLLSATPVQNDLIELYNILTLLKPGIFNTERDFRAAYVTPGKPRVPLNPDAMHDLMRDVMIRNTRGLVDVRLPPRHAVTLRPEPDAEEAECYRLLSLHVRARAPAASSAEQLVLRNLLRAAGSSPHAAASALRRYVRGRLDLIADGLGTLTERYAAIERGAKEQALIELLAANRSERTMVFAHQRATLGRLADLLGEQGIGFTRFDGSMTGPEKDAAIERFREGVPVLLSTESGGEGRNVQFANTLVNYDLPWNPMKLEQRIGRLHRIGQKREVFIFNLATRSTLEDGLLRVLDEKINMFELLVGEIGDILGAIDDERDFAGAVFAAWIESTHSEAGRDGDAEDDPFAGLARAMLRARERHTEAKVLDESLFGDEFEAA